MKMKWLGLIIMLAGIFFTGNFTLAQEGSELGTADSIIEKSIAAGASASDKTTLTNNGEGPVKYQMAIRGFQPAGDMGSIEFVGATQEEMLNWIEFSEDEFTVAPNETREISYVINVPEGAEAGGHYAVVSAVPAAGSDSEDGSEQLLGMLLVNITGDMKYKGEIKEFTTLFDKYKPGETIYFSVAFKNEGNVHVEPTGQIEIYKGNTKIDELEINPEGYFVFPDAIRKFQIDWKEGTNFGKYKAYANLAYGGTEEVSSGPISFWVISWTTIIIVLGVVIVAIILIVAITRKIKK